MVKGDPLSLPNGWCRLEEVCRIPLGATSLTRKLSQSMRHIVLSCHHWAGSRWAWGYVLGVGVECVCRV